MKQSIIIALYLVIAQVPTHVAKLGEITGKTRVLDSELGEITGKSFTMWAIVICEIKI